MSAADRCAGTGQPLATLIRWQGRTWGCCPLCEKHLVATVKGNAPAHVDQFKYAGYTQEKGPTA